MKIISFGWLSCARACTVRVVDTYEPTQFLSSSLAHLVAYSSNHAIAPNDVCPSGPLRHAPEQASTLGPIREALLVLLIGQLVLEPTSTSTAKAHPRQPLTAAHALGFCPVYFQFAVFDDLSCISEPIEYFFCAHSQPQCGLDPACSCPGRRSFVASPSS